MNDRKKDISEAVRPIFLQHIFIFFAWLIIAVICFTLQPSWLGLPLPTPSLQQSQNWLKPKSVQKMKKWGTFYLTSGFQIFLEVKFPSYPRETEGYFLSFLSLLQECRSGNWTCTMRRDCASNAGCTGSIKREWGINIFSAKWWVSALSGFLSLYDFPPRICFLVIYTLKDHTSYFIQLCLRRVNQMRD